MKKQTLFLLATCLGLLMTQFTPVAAFSPILPPGTQILKDLPYVENGGPDRTLDLYLPAKTDFKLPVVVWIHGGAWRSGAKGGWCPAYGLLAKGYAVVDMNYRLSVKDNAPFPAQLHDCKAAIRWLRANADKYNFDADHIGAWGHSAGGHLAAMLGVTGKVAKLEGDEGNSQYSSAVQAVADWSGPTDLTAILHGSDPKTKGMVVQLLGAMDPKAATDENAAIASPLTYVSADSAPFVIANGLKDIVVLPVNAEKLEAALKAAGVDATYTPVPDKDHGIGGPELEKQAADLFDKYLKPGTVPARK